MTFGRNHPLSKCANVSKIYCSLVLLLSTTAMQRLYIYNAALAIVGASLGGPAVRSIIAGDWGISILLMTIGGCGLVLGAVYQSLQTDPDDFNLSTGMLVLNIGAACLALFGTLLFAASS